MSLKFYQQKRSDFLLLFFICSLIFIKDFCFAQAGTSLGIKAGAGFSRYFFVLTPGYGEIYQYFVPVYQTGLVFNQSNEKNCGVQIEINYTQKAWNEKYGFNGQYGNCKALIEYLEVPFLTHFRIGKKRSAWIVNMGLHLSYARRVSIESTDLGTETSYIDYSRIPSDNLDYGLDGGVGYEIGKEKGVFVIQVMYSQGMENAFDREGQNPLIVQRSLNQSVFLSCIYKIHFSRGKVQKNSK